MTPTQTNTKGSIQVPSGTAGNRVYGLATQIMLSVEPEQVGGEEAGRARIRNQMRPSAQRTTRSASSTAWR